MTLPLLPLITGAFDLGGRLIDRLIPDPQVAAQAKVELAKMAQDGELQKLTMATDLAKAQVAVNIQEAKSAGFFRGGWRPYVGWTCGTGLAYQIILRPILEWITGIINAFYFAGEGVPKIPVPPSIDIETLLTLLFGMLGLGAYRTYEKVKGNLP